MCWAHGDCTIKHKLHVQDAVVRSKLVYGLESLQLTEGAIRRLDTFQLKGLRKILRLRTTYIERANSNDDVFRKAENALNLGWAPGRRWRRLMKLSDYYAFLKLKRYAQLVSAPPGDPASAVAFHRDTLEKWGHGKQRVGQPRKNWIEVTQEQFWDLLVVPQLPPEEQVPLYLGTEGHADLIRQVAGESGGLKSRIRAALGY